MFLATLEGCPRHHNQVHEPPELWPADALSLYSSEPSTVPIIVKVAPSNGTAKSTNRMADNTKAMLA